MKDIKATSLDTQLAKHVKTQQMWLNNKEFLDQQIIAKKEFWLSHDPFSPRNEQYFAFEVNYLIESGVKEFVKIGDQWKAIW